MILAIGGSLLFAASMGFAFEFDRRRKRREALGRFPEAIAAFQKSTETFAAAVGGKLVPAMRAMAEQMTLAAKALRVARVSPPGWEELMHQGEEIE